MSDRSDHSSEPRRDAVPTRAADRNRDLVADDDPGGDALLPSLDAGVTLLDVEGGRGVPVLQSLVLDHLLVADGPACWVDADGHATTTGLARIAPSRRLLDRIHVARGFTAYQHYAAVCALEGEVDRPGRDAPSLVVAPAVDALYRAADGIADPQARTLQARALAQLTALADRYDAPVLVTRTASDGFAAPVEQAADHRLRCERTRFGPRFVGDDFETLVYPVGGGQYQTTLACWRRLLTARAERVGVADSPAPPVPTGPAGTTGGVGTGVTVDGDRATLDADPLRDAWNGGR